MYTNVKAGLIGLAAMGLVACGSGSDDSSSSMSAEETGTLTLALTDAEEDFLSYQVDVLSATLVREDGTEVDLVAATTEVDFVEYQDLSELFMVTQVPVGVYSQVLLNLDYSDSEIIIQDEAGVSYTASAVDADGTELTTLALDVSLEDGTELEISRGGLHGLTLDLDLAASNTILSFEPAIVEVSPLLLVTATQDEEREHRARGTLASTDTDASQFVMNLLPMRHRDGEYGELTVETADDTSFEIDGTEYTGDTGLSALADVDLDTAIVVLGMPDSDTGILAASSVVVGTGADEERKDFVTGIVTARTEDTLTIESALVKRKHRKTHFADSLTVTLADTTEVTGHPSGDVGIEAISVGQKIQVAGDYSSDDDAADSEITSLDASSGIVRLKTTRVAGTVNTVSPLEVSLQSINGLDVASFDFSGTGSSEAEDADASAYSVTTSSLDLSNLEEGDWLTLNGYVAAFGTAPDDFTAAAVSEVSVSSNVDYQAYWTTADSAAVTLDGESLTLDVTNAVERLSFEDLASDLLTDASVSSITSTADSGRYSLQISGDRDSSNMYETYSEFLTALTTQLDADNEISQVSVSGTLDSDTGVLDADRIVIRFGKIGKARKNYHKGHK